MKSIFDQWWSDPFFLHVWENQRIYGRNRISSDQVHVHIRGGYGVMNYAYNSDSHHLIQDFYTGVMPYLSMRRPEPNDPYCSFSTDLSPQEQRLLSDGISFRDRSFRITDAVCNYIREATHHVMTYGEAHYEIVYSFEEGEITSFELAHIPKEYLYRFFGGYLQIIPWWTAKKAQCSAGFVFIPKNKILRLTVPKKLLTKRGLIKRLKRLFKLTNEIFPNFNMEAMKKGQTPTFDVTLYQKGRYLEVANLTKSFGWNQKTRQNIYFTEYYYFLRFLQSVKAKYYFREEYLNQLNTFLSNSEIGIDTTIVMNNFVDPEQIGEWEEKMKEGGLKFIDMFNDLNDR